MSDERKVSERYRELRREEPPRALDDAILAAARRAAETRPAPLVVPTGRRRWYFPLAAAAVIVLAVAVTMHVEREQPGEEIVTGQAVTGSVATPATPAKEPAQTGLRDQARAEEAKPEARSEEAKPAPRPERARSLERRFEYAPDPKPAAAPPAQAESRAQEYAAPAAEAQRAQAEAAARAEAERAADAIGQIASRASPVSPSVAPAPQSRPAPAAKDDRFTGARESARADLAERPQVLAKVQSETTRNETLASAASPEQWLQGIADLRRQRRHEEADKSLAEFRRRYPDYRLSEEVRAKVERR